MKVGAGVATSPHSTRVPAPRATEAALACLSSGVRHSLQERGSLRFAFLAEPGLGDCSSAGPLPIRAPAPAHRLGSCAISSAFLPMPLRSPFGYRPKHRLSACWKVRPFPSGPSRPRIESLTCPESRKAESACG